MIQDDHILGKYTHDNNYICVEDTPQSSHHTNTSTNTDNVNSNEHMHNMNEGEEGEAINAKTESDNEGEDAINHDEPDIKTQKSGVKQVMSLQVSL